MDQRWITRQMSQLYTKYKYVILIFLIGIFLMTFPRSGIKKDDAGTALPESDAGVFTLEERLEAILCRIDGAGSVKVLLAEGEGERIQYVKDRNEAITDDSSSLREDTVILSDSGRAQGGLVSQVIPARYRGAIILCQGAENPTVRLEVTQAVSNATGLSFEKISVLKMK